MDLSAFSITGSTKEDNSPPIEAISLTKVEERKENGNYVSFSDFVSRVDLRSANKRTLESLAYSGGFDSFGINRSQYFEQENEQSYIEKMIKFGNKIQKFEIDQFKKKCLIEGLDDIALSMEKISKIDNFEKKLTSERPWLLIND